MICRDIIELSNGVYESQAKPIEEVLVNSTLYSQIIKEMAPPDSMPFDAMYIRGLHVVVSRFVQDNEIIFKTESGWVRKKLSVMEPIVESQYRRITLGEE